MSASSEILDRFDPTDRPWAHAALLAFVLADIDDIHRNAALADAATELQTAGQPADIHFGPARDWATRQVADWTEDGADVWKPEDDIVVLGNLPLVLGWAAALSFLFTVAQLLHLWPAPPQAALTPGVILLPLVLSMVIFSVIAIHRAALRRWRRSVAAALASLVGLTGSIATAVLIVGTETVRLGTVETQSLLTMTLGYALVSYLAARIIAIYRPSQAATSPAAVTAATDQAWRQETTVLLRQAGHSERDIRRHLHEITGYAQTSGRPLREEFGSPRVHVATVPIDATGATRRQLMKHLIILGGAVLAQTVSYLDGGTIPMSLAVLTGAVVILVLTDIYAYYRVVAATRRGDGNTPRTSA
ncbi:hypothetical protein KEM60_01287 [Austwickia sp. TVS 96-490-7B]|uniref:hypothetical protein n=1 Tax=Austwickia sp. TVS 96-490-7B TaxID=2830843 RepID=UPI001C576D8D|nr:hypothetical protein [Austwickia sp. TVS 96-490-7B]MBW3085094.1 hypothetical protein [Austwickia sp. TVS 96-490-7B]